ICHQLHNGGSFRKGRSVRTALCRNYKEATLENRAPRTRSKPEPPGSAGDASPPRLADGIELLGEYRDSGFKEAPFLARRADGQVLQLPRLLYLVAENTDGHRRYAEIAESVTEAL